VQSGFLVEDLLIASRVAAGTAPLPRINHLAERLSRRRSGRRLRSLSRTRRQVSQFVAFCDDGHGGSSPA
jgi:hypothetical protein